MVVCGDNESHLRELPGIPLNTKAAGRNVMLLKVSPTLAKSWQQQREAGSSEPLGQLILTWDLLNPNKSPRQCTFELAGKDGELPQKFLLNKSKELLPMCIFSESTNGQLAAEGKIGCKLDMQRPIGEDVNDYSKICRDRLTKSEVKSRTVQILSEKQHSNIKTEQIYRALEEKQNLKRARQKAEKEKDKDEVYPSAHFARSFKNRKTFVERRVRGNRVQVEAQIFKMFESNASLQLRDIAKEIDQPLDYLKEILSEVCIFTRAGTSLGSYQLKPEYKP